MPLEFNESVRHKLYLIRIKLSKLPKYKGNILKVSWNDVINHILYQYSQVTDLTSRLRRATDTLNKLKKDQEVSKQEKKPETINLNITLNNPNQNYIAAVDNRHVNITQQNIDKQLIANRNPPPPPPPKKALPARRRIKVERNSPKTIKEELDSLKGLDPSEVWVKNTGEEYDPPPEIDYEVELPDRKIYDEYDREIESKFHPFNQIRKSDSFDAAETARLKVKALEEEKKMAEKRKKLLNPVIKVG